jgi:hypothetical protein
MTATKITQRLSQRHGVYMLRHDSAHNGTGSVSSSYADERFINELNSSKVELRRRRPGPSLQGFLFAYPSFSLLCTAGDSSVRTCAEAVSMW